MQSKSITQPNSTTQPDPTQQASTWLTKFSTALKDNPAAVVELFCDDCFWRDFVSFTWNIYTAEGKSNVLDMIQKAVLPAQPSNWKLAGEAYEINGAIEAPISFETKVGLGQGYLRMKDGKAWTFFTSMLQLKGHEEQIGMLRGTFLERGAKPGRKNWLQLRKEEQAELGIKKNPYVIIIGGGQAGIILGARLRLLNVPAIIIEKNEKPGDNWRHRYSNLVTHDTVWLNRFPYMNYPENWPINFPKDKYGDWLELYTKAMDLNYWGGTEFKSANFHEAKKMWTVNIVRHGKPMTIRSNHLVLATGLSGKANIPDLPGAEKFQGKVFHSSKFPGAEGYRGKNAIVVGSCTSAHDICQGLWEEGANVTMLQRNSSCVVQHSTAHDFYFTPLYSPAAEQMGITPEKADLINNSFPHKVVTDMSYLVNQEVKKHDAEFYDKLKKAGFLLDFGEDDTGFVMKYRRTASGYYFNLGASDLIINGAVKLKSGVTIDHFKQHSVVLTDGSELPADLIVFATGFKSMESWVEEFIGKKVAHKVGEVWGIGSGTRGDPGPWEGEERNMWKPTRQEGLWFQGGSILENRVFSKYVALQLKARMENMPTPLYPKNSRVENISEPLNEQEEKI